MMNVKESRKVSTWEDALWVPTKILKISGVWPGKNDQPSKRLQSYIFYMIALIFDVTILLEAKILIESQDYEALSTHLSTLGLYCGYIIEILIFKFKFKEICQMIEDLSLPTLAEIPSGLTMYRDKCVSVSNGISTFYISCVSASIALYLFKPLYTDLDLPNSFSLFEKNTATYVTVLCLQIFSVYYLVLTGICFDMLNISLLNVAAAQLDVLSKTLTDPRYRPDIIHEGSFIKNCVMRHMAIIRFVEQIEDCFKYISLIRCLFSITSICNGGFQLSHTEKLLSVAFLFNSAFVFDVLFEIGICCWFAEILLIKSLEVSDACYNYDWQKSSQENKKSLLILLVRSQKPLITTAGKFVPMGMRSFLSILKSAYSYFALMQSLYENHK